MVTTGLIVRLDAQPGKEEELATFLVDALPLVESEPRPSPGSPSEPVTHRSRSSTSSPTRRDVRHTSTGPSPQP